MPEGGLWRQVLKMKNAVTRSYQKNSDIWGIVATMFKICLAAAVLTVFAKNFSTALEDYQKLEDLQEESHFSLASSFVLEDCATERGLSVVYLSSEREDEEFLQRLKNHRKIFSHSIEVGLGKMKKTVKFSSEQEVVMHFEDWIDELDAFRARVDDYQDSNLTIPDVLAHYTYINDLLIYSVAEFTAKTDGDVAKRAMAWKNLLFEFDNLSKQRALASAIVQGWEPTDKSDELTASWIDTWVFYVKAGGRVAQAQDAFFFTTTPHTWSLFVQLLEGERHAWYEEMSYLLERGQVDDLGVPGAVYFWDEFTNYMNDVGPFRERSLEDLRFYSDKALDETRSRLYTNGVGLGIGIIACIFLLVEAGLSGFSVWKKRKTVKDLDSKFAEAKEVDEWSPT